MATGGAGAPDEVDPVEGVDTVRVTFTQKIPLQRSFYIVYSLFLYLFIRESEYVCVFMLLPQDCELIEPMLCQPLGESSLAAPCNIERISCLLRNHDVFSFSHSAFSMWLCFVSVCSVCANAVRHLSLSLSLSLAGLSSVPWPMHETCLWPYHVVS